jgi:formamidopyrimidine-DNA glycosylase
LDWLPGRTILEAARADAPAGPKYANLEQAANQEILAVNRRGKYLLLPLSRGDTVVIHLGMSGVIRQTPSDRHIRVRLRLSGDEPNVLYFQDTRRFGRFLVANESDFSGIPTLFQLGPEPLSDDFTADRLLEKLHSKTAIKTLLLNQRAVAGLGNIYVDEALWEIGVHPLTPGKTITKAEAQRLVTAVQRILGAAIDSGGTSLKDYRTVKGEEGHFQSALHAYGRAGEPCHRCQTPIEKIVVAQRGTHSCPRCQPLPTAHR